MRSRLGSVLHFYTRVLKAAIAKFAKEDLLTQSAAVAYYMIFSLPSILLIVLWTAAHFYKEVRVREALFSEVGALVGKEGAGQLNSTIEKLNFHEPTWWATIFGIGLLLFTATSVLVTLQTALNRIFEVELSDGESLGIWRLFYDRLISTGALLTLSFILLVSLVVDALISALSGYAAPRIGGIAPFLTVFDSIVLNVGASTTLFALFLRYLPDIRLEWRSVWFGALVTTGLFATGKRLIGFLIGNSTAAGLYEAAGSVLVLMLWVYYGSAIFLFVASFTFTRAKLLQAERDSLGS